MQITEIKITDSDMKKVMQFLFESSSISFGTKQRMGVYIIPCKLVHLVQYSSKVSEYINDSIRLTLPYIALKSPSCINELRIGVTAYDSEDGGIIFDNMILNSSAYNIHKGVITFYQ